MKSQIPKWAPQSPTQIELLYFCFCPPGKSLCRRNLQLVSLCIFIFILILILKTLPEAQQTQGDGDGDGGVGDEPNVPLPEIYPNISHSL